VAILSSICRKENSHQDLHQRIDKQNRARPMFRLVKCNDATVKLIMAHGVQSLQQNKIMHEGRSYRRNTDWLKRYLRCATKNKNMNLKIDIYNISTCTQYAQHH